MRSEGLFINLCVNLIYDEEMYTAIIVLCTVVQSMFLHINSQKSATIEIANSPVLMCQCFMDGKPLKRRLSDCGVNFNVNTKSAACDLSRHQDRGGSRFEVQFIPTSEPHKLESRLQKS